MNKRGIFITIEGVEGVGKSTMTEFIAEYLTQKGIALVKTREPGGSEIAEAIRQVLLNHYQETMSHDTETLLMFAGRAQHIASVIQPALQKGQWVVCDRFTDATYAYQGGGRGVESERIAELETWVQGELRPDLTLLLDAELAVGQKRMESRGMKDRFEREGAAFFERIRQCYLQRAQRFHTRYKLIDASQSVSQVKAQITEVLELYLETQNA